MFALSVGFLPGLLYIDSISCDEVARSGENWRLFQAHPVLPLSQSRELREFREVRDVRDPSRLETSSGLRLTNPRMYSVEAIRAFESRLSGVS